jgi:hypothetical protein|tara:strand:+ start:227 stop:481 length:255 start_codon:yes stop_codon:yes gene_type:complete
MTSETQRKLDICDDCSLIAYDNGIGVVREWDYDDLDEFDKAEAGAWQAQVEFMVDIGGMVADHACSAKTEPDLNIQCDCGCRSN